MCSCRSSSMILKLPVASNCGKTFTATVCKQPIYCSGQWKQAAAVRLCECVISQWGSGCADALSGDRAALSIWTCYPAPHYVSPAFPISNQHVQFWHRGATLSTEGPYIFNHITHSFTFMHAYIHTNLHSLLQV